MMNIVICQNEGKKAEYKHDKLVWYFFYVNGNYVSKTMGDDKVNPSSRELPFYLVPWPE